jgi:hypothetical protein
MSKWIGMTIAPAVTGRSLPESPSTQARSLEGRPLGMDCSVMLPEPSRLRLLELGSSFVTALGEQRQPMTGLMAALPAQQEVKSDRNAAAPLRWPHAFQAGTVPHDDRGQRGSPHDASVNLEEP